MNQKKKSAAGRSLTMARAQHASGGAWSYSARGYALRQSLRQLTNRKFATFSTLLVLGTTLALPALILFIAGSLNQLRGDSLKDESLTLYLQLEINDLEGAALAQSLITHQSIDNTDFVSAEAALELLASKTDISEALSLLDANPLPGAIVVFPTDAALKPGETESLAEELLGLPEVARVQFDLAWVKRLQAVLALAKLISWILAGFLTLTALLVIGNTIRLELARRRPEIEVSSLLGASRGFIHRPLLMSGALYGLMAGVLACVIAMLTLLWLRSPAGNLSQLYGSAFELKMPTASHFLLVISLAAMLGLLGALMTLYRRSQQFVQNS